MQNVQWWEHMYPSMLYGDIGHDIDNRTSGKAWAIATI